MKTVPSAFASEEGPACAQEGHPPYPEAVPVSDLAARRAQALARA